MMIMNEIAVARGIKKPVPILMWHKIGYRAPSRYWVTVEQFRYQLATVHKLGYTPISIAQLDELCTVESDRKVPEKPIILTFDDGYLSLYTHVFPLLQQYSFPAVAFIPTGKIGDNIRQDNRWDGFEAEYKTYHLLWDEVQMMKDSGLIEFHSHTVTHADLEDPLVDVEWELTYSKYQLEKKVGQPTRFFSYPYGVGADNPSIRALMKKTGYHAAFAAWGGIQDVLEIDQWAICRVEVTNTHGVNLSCLEQGGT